MDLHSHAAKTFHIEYYNSQVWHGRTHWLGVPTLKCPLDMWLYQELIYQTKPDMLIECGTFKGGSALFFAHVFDAIDHGEVLTIDIVEQDFPKHSRISYLIGDSTASETFSEVRFRAHGKRCMVILDSRHTYDHVLTELRLYSNLVALNSLLIVEDTNVNNHPVAYEHGPGPAEAVGTFLQEDVRFDVDRDCEKFGLTFAPGGFLRRVR